MNFTPTFEQKIYNFINWVFSFSVYPAMDKLENNVRGY